MKSLSVFSTALVAVLFLSACSGGRNKDYKGNYDDGKLISEMNAVLTEAIITDLFSPPVASRIYAYPNIAVHEIFCQVSGAVPFEGKINGLRPIPKVSQDKPVDYYVAAMHTFNTIGRQMVYTEAPITEYENHKIDSLKKAGIDEQILANSILYGDSVADHILKWAMGDNYKQTRSAERYSLLKTDGSWLPTPPDYTPAMEPHWHELRTFVINSHDVFRPDSMVRFSKEKGSEFYKINMEVYDAVNNLDSNQYSMAKFWDDNPAVTEHAGHIMMKNKKMTPGGHWIAITSLVVRDKNLNMAEASKAFSVTATALADAFISCWDAKYYYQTIRPVTYINDLIDPEWTPILQTPPFPEYPSGHSAISASAAKALTGMFGDNFAFTDSSELRFDLPVRSFNSFEHAAQEVALSRFYGGIHYTISNTTGAEMGRKVGDAVIDKLVGNKLAQK